MKVIIRSALVILAMSLLTMGCGKNNPLAPEVTVDQETAASFTVRPDFETVDLRPADVIAQHKLTDKHVQPAELEKDAVKGAKYALVIGISDYAGTANDLRYCDDDARDWAARLKTEGYTVTVVTDGQATRANIESQLKTLASRSIAGNEIAFCYSGHGSKGNMISCDLYYLSSTWFATIFANAASTKMAFAFDACQIGAFGTALKKTGRVIALASSSTTYSYDGDATMQNGVFTYYQMKGFDALGYVYYEPDCKYACDQMKVWAASAKVKVAPSYVDVFTGDLNL
jgi:uncharacterized caspase-like protein